MPFSCLCIKYGATASSRCSAQKLKTEETVSTAAAAVFIFIFPFPFFFPFRLIPTPRPQHFYQALQSLPFSLRLSHQSWSPDSHILLLICVSFFCHPQSVYIPASFPQAVSILSIVLRAFAFKPLELKPEPTSHPAHTFYLPHSCSPVNSSLILFGLTSFACKRIYHDFTIKMMELFQSVKLTLYGGLCVGLFLGQERWLPGDQVVTVRSPGNQWRLQEVTVPGQEIIRYN